MTINKRVLRQLEEARQFYLDNPGEISQEQWVKIRDAIKQKLEK